MIIVAHPDDEILGLGSTINRLINNDNVNVHTLILGEGITSRSDSRDEERWLSELKTHNNNIEKARSIIGYQSLSTYQFPDNRFDTIALLDIVKVIENEKEKFKPDIIFTHHHGDLNVDHQITNNAVITSCRPVRNETTEAIISFETPSSTEWNIKKNINSFQPNLFFKISKSNLDAKIKAMESYIYEKRKYPHPRSPEALKILAQRNGLIVGVDYAEAFEILRLIKI
ncbi:PIG-L family deacetylase [Flavobacteriaceae bacterium]|nr:PIG-L family deacetylase [Flavobacteriaceae bacterium]